MGWKGPLKAILVQCPCNEEEHFQWEQVAQSKINAWDRNRTCSFLIVIAEFQRCNERKDEELWAVDERDKKEGHPGMLWLTASITFTSSAKQVVIRVAHWTVDLKILYFTLSLFHQSPLQNNSEYLFLAYYLLCTRNWKGYSVSCVRLNIKIDGLKHW